jgi:hypothetical protein
MKHLLSIEELNAREINWLLNAAAVSRPSVDGTRTNRSPARPGR